MKGHDNSRHRARPKSGAIVLEHCKKRKGSGYGCGGVSGAVSLLLDLQAESKESPNVEIKVYLTSS